jgi:hypothetical protein
MSKNLQYAVVFGVGLTIGLALGDWVLAAARRVAG